MISSRTAVAGHGIDHGTLSRLGSSLNLDKGHGITQPSKYFGGEVRQEDNGSQAVIAIGKFTLVNGTLHYNYLIRGSYFL